MAHRYNSFLQSIFFNERPDQTCTVIIVAFLENVFGKRNYRVLVRVSVCVCVCFRVCVFLHDNSKRNRSRNTKLEYTVHENSSDEFNIELRQIKVKGLL